MSVIKQAKDEYIHNFLEKVEILWKEQPSLRFCQLLSNVTNGMGDFFYVKDVELEQRIADKTTKLQKNQKEYSIKGKTNAYDIIITPNHWEGYNTYKNEYPISIKDRSDNGQFLTSTTLSKEMAQETIKALTEICEFLNEGN